MKKSSLILILFLNVIVENILSQPEIRFTLNNCPSHPRILMGSGEEKKIYKNILSSKTWTQIHNDILSECDKITTLPLLERKKVGMRLLAVSREALRRIFFLSYAYRMTGENKYLLRAEKEMLTVARFSDWNPSHFLDVAEMTLGVAIGYDWLFNQLTDESKQIVREAIIKKGLQPSFDSKYNWFLNARHNWNQVCNAGMTFGALAVYEENSELCKDIITRSVSAIRLPMKEYDPDGAYPEGYAYWEYGTTFNVLMLDALTKVFQEDFSVDIYTGFMLTAAYYENMTGIKGDSFNYADCGEEYGLTPAMFWFANKMNDSSLLWVEKNFLNKRYSGNYIENRILPTVMIWGSKTDIDKINPPQKLWWSGRGVTPVALMRSSWVSPDAVYIGFKGGTASSNHAHMDAGSFVFEADGIRWAMDFGKQDYESLESQKLNIWTNEQNSERWKVFRYNNFVHNTLTVNDELHCASGYAPLVGISDNEDFMSAICDLSPVFTDNLSFCKRGVALIDKKYAMIRDEVSAPSDKPAKIRWTMLTSADVKSVGEDRIVLAKDEKELSIKIVTNHPVKIKTWNTRSENSYDADNTGTVRVGFESNVHAGENAYFTVFLLPERASYDPKKNVPLDQWHVKALVDN